MSPREQLMLKVTLGVVGSVIALFYWILPFLDGAEAIAKEREKLEDERRGYDAMISRRPQVMEEWKKLQQLLKKQEAAEIGANNLLAINLVLLSNKAGVVLAVNGVREQKLGEFNEVALETRFDTEWDKLIDLLFEIHKSPELLRTRRLTVKAEPERSSKLTVDLSVSTIEALAPVKGPKK